MKLTGPGHAVVKITRVCEVNLKDAVGVDEPDVGVEMIAVMDAMMQPLKQLRVRQVAVVNRRYKQHPRHHQHHHQRQQHLTGWRFSAVVASFVVRTKLLNVEPG